MCSIIPPLIPPSLPADSPEAALALRTSAADVLDDLQGRIGDAAAGKQNAAVLAGGLLGPMLLDEIALLLETPHDPLDREHEDDEVLPALPALAEPAGADGDAGRLVRQAGLLRKILPRHLARALGRELTPAESVKLHAALDHGLERRVAATTALQRRRVRAEADAQSKYLAFLSHDLRGNLNGVMLTMELLRRDLQGEERFAESVDDLDSMRGSMIGLVGTMDRFLQAERLRDGRVEVSPCHLDLGEFLRGQCRQIGRQTRGGPAVQVDVAAGLHVVSDAGLLGLIVQNLLSNCVKYGAGRPVRVEAADHPSQAGVVRIAVSDRGPGMTAELVARLFEPFTRGRHGGVAGTGLGLFIAKQSADLLRAALRVESGEHEGTRFLIDLPQIV